jgi:hypothetical protein
MIIESQSETAVELSKLVCTENAAPIERLTIWLQEAEMGHHGRREADWSRWYAAFVDGRQRGASVQAAQAFADHYTVGSPHENSVRFSVTPSIG